MVWSSSKLQHTVCLNKWRTALIIFEHIIQIFTFRHPVKLKLKNISNEKGELKVDRRDQFSQELVIRADLQKNLKEELSFYLDYKYIFENQNSWKISTGFVYAF